MCSVAVAFLALAANIIGNITGLGQGSPLLKAAFKAFILAALVEELVKYLTGNRMIKKNNDKVSWLDCMAYGMLRGYFIGKALYTGKGSYRAVAARRNTRI